MKKTADDMEWELCDDIAKARAHLYNSRDWIRVGKPEAANERITEALLILEKLQGVGDGRRKEQTMKTPDEFARELQILLQTHHYFAAIPLLTAWHDEAVEEAFRKGLKTRDDERYDLAEQLFRIRKRFGLDLDGVDDEAARQTPTPEGGAHCGCCGKWIPDENADENR
jgi:hypothetical protein